MKYLAYHATPVQEVQHPKLQSKGVRLLVKREDLNHPTVSGNKWWKLKYNLLRAQELETDTVLTFGGAYSNHICATAAAAADLGLKSIGIIRGEASTPLNPTLSFSREKGMNLHFVSRSAYTSKNDPAFVEALRAQFGDFYLIPEGGTNELALKGVSEFYEEIKDIPFSKVFLPVGTGGTIAGLVAGSKGSADITGVVVLKNGNFMFDEINDLLRGHGTKPGQFDLITDCDFGGYAKTTPELIDFIRDIAKNCQLPLDHVYTAKMLFAIFRDVESGKIPAGSTILAIHTGGLQGSRYFRES